MVEPRKKSVQNCTKITEGKRVETFAGVTEVAITVDCLRPSCTTLLHHGISPVGTGREPFGKRRGLEAGAPCVDG